MSDICPVWLIRSLGEWLSPIRLPPKYLTIDKDEQSNTAIPKLFIAIAAKSESRT
jgi:hypothetical protein